MTKITAVESVEFGEPKTEIYNKTNENQKNLDSKYLILHKITELVQSSTGKTFSQIPFFILLFKKIQISPL